MLEESDDIVLLASDDSLVVPLVVPLSAPLLLPPQLLKVSEVASIEAASIMNGIFFIKEVK
ncbi:hypothetical protein [Hymenobacter crusticola]|nr:hypothetical protein [Hymenobacter crusticola]